MLTSKFWKFWGSVSLVIMCLTLLTDELGAIPPLPLVQGTEMTKIQVSVSVDDTHIAQIEQVSKQLQSSGLVVEQTLPSIGIISGLIEPDQLPHLSQIEGVQSVEPEQTYQLAPPNSPVQ
jgi:hypothetical protein